MEPSFLMLITVLLTLTGGVSTMRRIAILADTALRCTACSPIHVVSMYGRFHDNVYHNVSIIMIANYILLF